MQELNEISKTIHELKNAKEVKQFMTEILTEAELATLSKRWRICKMLSCGTTQREIARKLNVSLCKITRGAKVLKEKNSLTAKIFDKRENHE